MAASEGPLCVVMYVTSCLWAGGVLTGSRQKEKRTKGNSVCVHVCVCSGGGHP